MTSNQSLRDGINATGRFTGDATQAGASRARRLAPGQLPSAVRTNEHQFRSTKAAVNPDKQTRSHLTNETSPATTANRRTHRTSTTSTSAGTRKRSHRPGELPQGPGGTYSPGPECMTLARSAPTWVMSGPEKQTVEDQRRSAATVANTVAKPLDNSRRTWTTLEYRPSVRTATDGSGRLAHSYGSEGWGFESLRARPAQRPVTA